MRRIISMLMENEPGALSRVVGLFSQRGYNIETLNVAPTDDPTLSRLTLTTVGSDLRIEQLTKQLNKLVDVVKLADLTDGAHVEVGVGRHDREAFALVHGDVPTADALASVVESVRSHRRSGGPMHPLARLASERWLRASLVADRPRWSPNGGTARF